MSQQFRDNSESLSNCKRRWIPPSSLRRDAHKPNDDSDHIFRKVRSILNKITPERFTKLSQDILNVGLNSPVLIKGVILLVFEKALDEPKYCSLYAQLCKKLSENAPNFEAKDPPTYNILLLHKCQEEFEKRREASERWDRNNGQKLSAQDEEKRTAARRKMVGNIRFIGELGKLEIVHISILHNCIQQLLARKGTRKISDLAEDLECLCQIMKTCGKVLDKPKAKNLMDQYFERMVQLSINDDLPTRIRFMLRDAVDLRRNNWVPRKSAQPDAPKTIQQVRVDAARELGVYIPQNHGMSKGPISPLSAMPSFFAENCALRTGLDAVFGAPPIEAVMLGTGPGVISSQPDVYGYDSNSYNNSSANREGPFRSWQPSTGAYGNTNNYYQNKHFNAQNNYNGRLNNANNQQSNYNNNASNKELPPRFVKMFGSSQTQRNVGLSTSKDTVEELSLRPVSTMAQSKSQKNGFPNGGGPSNRPRRDFTSSPTPLQTSVAKKGGQGPPIMLNEPPPIVIKQVSADKKSNKKDKGPSRDEYLKRLNGVLEKVNGSNSFDSVYTDVSELKIPEKFMTSAILNILKFLVEKNVDGKNMELGADLLKQMRQNKSLQHDKLIEAYKQLLDHMDDVWIVDSEIPSNSSEIPVSLSQIPSNLSQIISLLIDRKLFSLPESFEPLEGGRLHPLFLSILKNLVKMQGKTKFGSIFDQSKVNLMNLVSENCRTKEKLAEYLEQNDLIFLYPLLRIQSDLWEAIIKDSGPQVFYKYIKDTVDQEHYIDPSFIHALFTVIVKYITQETTMAPGKDPSTTEKTQIELEKTLLSRYKPVLQTFLHDHAKLQVTAIYALQMFTHTSNYPKGMLLRWFVNLYDLEILEEDAFLTWKEDIRPDFPGKGKALFQVNQWLTWLQETEADEDEEEDA